MAVGGVWVSITAIDKNTRSTDRLNLACDKNESKYHIKTYSLYSCSNRVLIKYSVTMRLQPIGYKKDAGQGAACSGNTQLATILQ